MEATVMVVMVPVVVVMVPVVVMLMMVVTVPMIAVMVARPRVVAKMAAIDPLPTPSVWDAAPQFRPSPELAVGPDALAEPQLSERTVMEARSPADIRSVPLMDPVVTDLYRGVPDFLNGVRRVSGSGAHQ
ncbi:hypothetical protein ACFY4C_04160 [Actinomadura viridis]|uniref:hypothetical protein n=1 Tax=Actinomadura viridis TaxID=58110 RepID=UPI0036AEFD33